MRGGLTGAVIGAVGGPIFSGLAGFVIISLVWLAQELAGALPQSAILPFAAVFGVLIAPIGASIGVVVGAIIGAFDRWFGTMLNAASFGGMVGSVVGLLAAIALFAGDIVSIGVAIITLAATGVAVGWGVKRLQQKLKKR